MNSLEEMELKLKQKKQSEFSTRFNMGIAALSLAGIITLCGSAVHKNVDHLNSKCPFAFLYGNKIAKHHVTEVKEEHPDLIKVSDIYTAPVGYTLGSGMCYKYLDDGTKVYAFPEIVGQITEIDNMTEEQFKEQIRKLYK